MKKNTLTLVALVLAVALGACTPDENEGKKPSSKLPEGKTYAELCFKYVQPKLNFDLGMYKMSSIQAGEWPFKTSNEALGMLYQLLYWPKGEQKPQQFTTQGTSTLFPIKPGTDYSVLAYSANLVYSYVIPDITGTPTCPTQVREGNQPDDIFSLYLPTYEAPTGYRDYEKRNDAELGEIYVCSDSVTLVPLTKPYQIEILDPSGLLTSVENIAFNGFADSFDLITGKASQHSSEIYIEEALPVQAYTQILGNGERKFIGNVAAIKLRTWGRVANEDVEMSFSVIAKGKNFNFKVTLTNEIDNLPDGGVISVTLPNGTF